MLGGPSDHDLGRALPGFVSRGSTAVPAAPGSSRWHPGGVRNFETHAALQEVPDAPLHDRLGVEITAAGPERVVGRMPVEGNTTPFGLLHGGASAALAEGLGSVGAHLVAPPGHHAVGIELSATHHRAAREGWVTGTATPVHVGRTLTTWAIEVRDGEDALVCSARLTCLLRPARAGATATANGAD
jgi:1,4-dihydroxy-2-naphthoyl-CoA hydrolase